MRALAVLLAGVLIGALGLIGLLLIDPTLAAPAFAQPALAQPAQGSLRDEPAAWPFADEPASARQPGPATARQSDPATAQQSDPALDNRRWRASTATRHVPTPEEAALTGALHPATDRVMALLIGWILLALLGGGLLVPRRLPRS
jgi:hypothetical protein